MLCVAVSYSGWLLLRQARFCSCPPLVLSLRPCAYRRCLPVTYAYLTLPERFSSQDSSTSSILGISLSRGRLFGNGLWCSRGFGTNSFVVYPFYRSISFQPLSLSGSFSLSRLSLCVPMQPRYVDYIVVIDVTRVRFLAAGRKRNDTEKIYWPLSMDDTHRREVLSVFLGDPNQKHLAKSLCLAWM